MNIPDEAPKINPWPFIISDAVLIAAAYFIGSQAHVPFSTTVVLAIGILIFIGAVLAVAPFLINATRQQENALLERQREIAALAQTTAASAEQLSIATASLQGFGDHVAKSLKMVEQLPSKLQEKIHEFKIQLNEVSVSENEVLSQEVNALRASETERIESVATTVRKLAAEFSQLESATRKNVAELSETLAKFSASAQHAASAAATSISDARSHSEKSLAAAQSTATRAIKESVRRSLAEIDHKLAQFSRQLTEKIESAAHSPKTEHRLRSADESTTPATDPAAPSTPSPAERIESASSSHPIQSNEPLSHSVPKAESVEPRESIGVAVSSPLGEGASRPPRKKAARKAADAEMSLGLEGNDDFSQVTPEDAHASAVSTDGLTRLIVTAYIGIGNKLFVRGEGPGLSWEKGVPLQFVSIGKWRWETADATQPVRTKLFKNDELECGDLGEVLVDPGHQREVTARF